MTNTCSMILSFTFISFGLTIIIMDAMMDEIKLLEKFSSNCIQTTNNNLHFFSNHETDIQFIDINQLWTCTKDYQIPHIYIQKSEFDKNFTNATELIRKLIIEKTKYIAYNITFFYISCIVMFAIYLQF